MKQLEQERDVLLQGSDAVEGAYTWYQRQLQAVQRRQHDMRQAGTHQHVRRTGGAAGQGL